MKKITDERLRILQLKNFKIAFIIENLVIILLLIYELFKNLNKFSQVLSFSNPIWTIFIIAMISISVLSQNVTAAMEDKPKLSLSKVTFYFLLEIIVFSCLFLIFISPFNLWLALICGSTVSLIVTGVVVYNNHFRF